MNTFIAYTMPHIILAEDEDTTRWMLNQVIQKAYPDICISAVWNGQAAWLLYKQRGADLVVADVCMPMINGLELARMIRSRSARVPIILISGKLPIKDQLFERPYLHILSKPFDSITFLNIVAQALDASHCELER